MKKNILFYFGFHTNLIDYGDGNLGGTETVTINLAHQLSKMGYNVTIMAQNISYGEKNGVFYTGDNPDYSEPIDYLISVGSMRGVTRFKNHKVGKFIIYWHNTEQDYWDKEYLEEDSYENPNYHHIAVSDWHKKFISYSYGIENIDVVPNFINPELFSSEKEILKQKEGNKFIYTSDLERDFDKVLEKLKDYKKNYELHVSVPQYALDYAKEYLSKINNPNIIFHESLNKRDLYKLMEKCDYWLYPTDYFETFCITALEMQMNYVVPITSMVAGLQHSVELNQDFNNNDTLSNKQHRRTFAEWYNVENAAITFENILGSW